MMLRQSRLIFAVLLSFLQASPAHAEEPFSPNLLHPVASRTPIDSVVPSHVPDWEFPRKISVGERPTFFTYMDKAGEDKKDNVVVFDRWLAEQPLTCIGRAVLNGGATSVVFKNLPAGKNFFSITCTGRCENVKYAISRNRSLPITHFGVMHVFPWIHATGALT